MFPQNERPDWMRVPLRSGRRRNIIDGVYSLQTALSAHDLTEIVPSQRHITVAKSTQSELPDMIVLQYGEISGLDVETCFGNGRNQAHANHHAPSEKGKVPIHRRRLALRLGVRCGKIRESEIPTAAAASLGVKLARPRARQAHSSK